MDNYRLYFMTDDGRHISRFEPIKAASDQLAIEAAARFRGRAPLELYFRGRMVHHFAADDVATGSPGDGLAGPAVKNGTV